MIDLILDSSPQGSDAWLAARKGLCTASRFKDALDTTAKGLPSAKQNGYAFDLARERCGGNAPQTFQNAAMRFGTEQEPFCRMAYEADKGVFVDEQGFLYTPDQSFGVSVDGFVGADGIFECKTMVSSDTLFTAVVEGDISAYRDQCVGAMWLTGRKWVDLCLWAPDLADIGRDLTIVRIDRDNDEIAKLESGLLAFWRRVQSLEAKLRGQAELELAA
jgi:exodeoxyribonuclease (lambda-induced)